MKHLIDTQSLSKEWLDNLLSLTQRIKQKPQECKVTGKILASIFFEPSTRTRLSFESAMLRLGGSVITTEDARADSSATKGETIEDTVKVLSYYSDIIALRHFEIGTAKKAASVSSIPILNAGDGAGEHPSQALLDLFTIYEQGVDLNDFTICMVGDLLHGRTVRSLSCLLAQFYKPNIIFVAPPQCKMSEDVLFILEKHQIKWRNEVDFKKAIAESDCIYMTRFQRERFADMNMYESVQNTYQFDTSCLPLIKKNAFVLHPLPRCGEIAVDVDNDPRMLYFKQAENGVFVRMALIYFFLVLNS